MFGVGTKKMLNIMILKILERYSDERRPLTQKRILELLEIEYGMKCDRRSVKANLLSLKEMGYDINLTRGIYIRRDFEEAELRIFSKTLSKTQASPVDWFGKDFKILKMADDKLLISVKVNETAMKFWIMQYGENIEIVDPSSLRETVRNTAEFIANSHQRACDKFHDI